jgi:hypothetical protein
MKRSAIHFATNFIIKAAPEFLAGGASICGLDADWGRIMGTEALRGGG